LLNRFVRWRRAGVWDRIMAALATSHDAAVQMIDKSIARVHQHGACIAGNKHQHMGREADSRAKFTRYWTPMVCQWALASRPAKHTTIA
jgi:hypothetical protein